ncbi:hypothetical protein [Streptomyces viridosporus]|uniref:hypothetical protein n=1 Tax=Streptomyces viridosporus TaxID=67581 RepID=UPI0036FAF56A
MQHTPMIPPVDRRTFGHGAFVVQAAEDTRDRAEQLAVESADRHIAENYPAVAALLAEPAGLLTEAQTTLTYDNGLDGHRTAPVETEQRDVDSISSDAENQRTPLFSAEIAVTDRTEIWFGYGTTIGEVSPAKARQIAATMRDFAARLDALCDVADEIAAQA